MLRRAMACCRKVLRLPDEIKQYAATIGYRPRAGADTIVGEAVVMVMGRMGSLNALGQTVKKTLDGSVRLFFAVAHDVRQDVCAPGCRGSKAA